MGRRLRPALLLLVLVVCTAADGNVGCLFSSRLCVDQVEWCYDDHAFGKCLKIYEEASEEDLLRHELTNSELRAFERELQRLLVLGYRWSHLYTQCILQAMLHAINHKLQYEPAVCDNLSEQEIRAGAMANVDPQEMAVIKFTPNALSDAEMETNFANEVYFPPGGDLSLPPEDFRESFDDQDESPEYDAWQEMMKDLYQRKFKRSKGHVFSRLYNTPGDFRKGHETRDLSIEDLEDIFNKERIAGDSSDTQQNGYLSPQDIWYLLQPENQEELRALTSQLSYGDSGVSDENAFRDPLNKWLENQDLDQLRSTLAELKEPFGENPDPYYLTTSEFLTKNKMQTDRFNHQYNTPDGFRQGLETKDIALEEKQDSDGEMVEPRIYVDEDEAESEHSRDDTGSGEEDHVDRLRELEYLANNQINPKEEYSGEALRQMEDTALMSRLLNIWRSAPGGRPAPVYTEGGMVYLPTPTDSEYSDKNQLLDRSLGAFLSDYEWGFKRKERLDVKKPGPPFDTHNAHFNNDVTNNTPGNGPQVVKKGEVEVEVTTQDVSKSHDTYDVDSSYAYVGLKDSLRTWKEGARIVQTIGELLHLEPSALSYPRVDRNEVTFRVEDNSKSWNASEVAMRIDGIKDELKKELGVEITSAGVGDKTKYPAVLRMEGIRGEWIDWDNFSETGTMWAGLVAGTLAAAVAATALFLLARHHQRRKDKLRDLTTTGDTEASQDYKELCRARMSGKWQPGGGGGILTGGEKEGGQRIASLSKDSDGNSPSTRSSTSSWSEEPALTNMDISTGHMVLTYMEDHLKNKDRLEQEWRALCAYEAEPCATHAAEAEDNIPKNRNPGVLPYDHSRIVLNDITNVYNSDYINASTITDHDPRNPAYIAAQGPLPETVADWWQMVWEQGSVVLVMLTRLSEGSVLCHRYWPEEGSQLYHIYEVHLVSEHIWCDDYLVRSFYLKNLKTGETRTVTQFHFLSWPDRGVPSSTKALLEFRRKVNKSYRGRSCPIVVHCSDGAGRTGTYCLIDMVLNRMAKGAKEIDIAATLEHIRDQRPHMVTTKQQFEFVLMAVAEEVHAILKALPAQLQQQHEKREKELASDKEKQDKDK